MSADQDMSSKALQPLLSTYSFPTQGLKPMLEDPSKTPLVLVACGSFSPVTYLHLRMFEMADDYVRFSTEFELVGAYISPVSDAYKKIGLAKAEHRLRMCELVVAQEGSSWLMLDPWEALQDEYSPTTEVLDHFNSSLNEPKGGVKTVLINAQKPVKVVLLAGADLIQTMSIPTVWTHEELDHILGRYLTIVVEREGTDIKDALAYLKQWEQNIHVIPQLIQNTISSSLVRLFIKNNLSVKYLVPPGVLAYIVEHGLYKGTAAGKPNPELEARMLELRMSSRPW